MANKLLLFILCATIATLIAPSVSQAFTYNYYKPLDNFGNNLLISWGPFGSLQNYNCDLNNFSCSKTDRKNFPKNDNLSIANDNVWYNPGKNLAVYKTTSKTLSEKITRYYISSYSQNQWSDGKQLFITDDIQKIYWPQNNKNEFIFLTAPNSENKEVFVRFNFSENREVSRISISGEITNETISPDGLWLAYYAPLNKGIKSTVLLNLLAQAPKEYRFDYSAPKDWELLLDEDRILAFSPDNHYFAFLEDNRGFSAARLVNLTDIQLSSLTAAKTVGSNSINTALDIWFPAGNTLLVAGNNKKNTLDWYLYSYDIAADNLAPIVSDLAYMYELRPIGNKILLPRLSGPNLVPVLYDPATKKINELKVEKSIGTSDISKEIVNFKNNLNGVIIKNKNLKLNPSTPLVIWLHGGPFRQIGKDYHSYPSYAVYDWILDQLALQGAVVLKMDYTGSWGYGNSTAYDLPTNVGKNDVQNVYDTYREIAARLNFKGRTYLMGNSYGGYLAPRALAAYPKTFSGAIPINGVYEWRTLLNYLRTSIFNVHFNGLYDPNDSHLFDQASITEAINNLTPQNKIVIINGMADKTINPDQSYTFYELLKTTGKNAQIISIPDEDHIFSKVSSIETICQTAAKTIGLSINKNMCLFK